MIIVKLMGGLGNQLFQYAFARAFSARTGRPVFYDLSLYESGTSDYPLDLQRFAVPLPAANEGEVARLSDDGRSFLDKVYGRLVGKEHALRGPCIQEPSFRFSPRVAELQRDELYFIGYWQSERYFLRVAAELHGELVLKGRPSDRMRSLRTRLAGSRTVSVHVRRGDYVRNPMFRSIYRTLGRDYYDAAFGLVVRSRGRAIPVVFTDDPDWARLELALSPDQLVVEPQPESAAEDMVLMSECDDHIIANSTFSWWGAWLDPRPSKMVVSPKDWFHPGRYSMRDLLPEAWTRL
jgi:hypothetical protein